MGDIEITDDERRNGWTEETLAAYVAEREQAQAESVLNRPLARPKWANNRYDVMGFGR